MTSLQKHLKMLEDWFSKSQGALVAFSGGVDSSLVAFLALHFLGKDRCLAVISASPSLKMSELDGARQFARKHGIPIEVIVTREMENPNYTSNPNNRCYYCKHTLYTELDNFRERFPGWQVMNGQNTDDLGDYRPGLQAAKEFEVRAPLGECGIDKEGVRNLASHFGLECWDKPASPCLASRVPYGEEVTFEKLRQIEKGEAHLLSAGFPVCRVRHFGEAARIEVPPEEISRLKSLEAETQQAFRKIGFGQIEIDPEGFVSGKLNRVLGSAS
ncbi:ATP-dependent sacrificial sulfur transferase LarE [Puniceicoccales bacterium CK1056]|uniref:ATP-dependent sacrificial sulfur transferase LarE n=1 Tax=Oceanipulchritudo coccoides TaxID=2706888 RepID=A0A6B2M5H3_9BACT|nr:ATP-dependent sacrificial sulfur transferase LarE [Oceanipulchritudo coccoides]NDV63472.1 ATP-dependent sacrificial sulfur transferase LarE [Oceanipulchritudo coccoides]